MPLNPEVLHHQTPLTLMLQW